MPTYEYRCARCGEHLEVFQSFTEAPLTKHQGCGGKLAKVLSPAGIVLKGSGFYKNDSKSDRRRSGAKPGEKPGEKKDKQPAASSGDSSSSSGAPGASSKDSSPSGGSEAKTA